MTDEEIYCRQLALLENEEERLQMRKDLYRETHEREVFNAREHESGRQTLEKAEQENEAARKVRGVVVGDLERTDKGKDFLQKEASEVQQQVQARDAEYRAQKAEKLKQEQAKSIEEAKEKRTAEEVAKLPKVAEVSKEEITTEQKDGKHRAADAMAVLSQQEHSTSLPPKNITDEEREKQKVEIMERIKTARKERPTTLTIETLQKGRERDKLDDDFHGQ